MKKPIPMFFAVLLIIASNALTGCQKEGDGSASVEDAANAKPYPLKVCVVSGEELGSMGDPVVRVYEGQEIKFCCKNCIGEFEDDPAKFMAKLTQGAAPQVE